MKGKKLYISIENIDSLDYLKDEWADAKVTDIVGSNLKEMMADGSISENEYILEVEVKKIMVAEFPPLRLKTL